ncbi:hypothetical protein FO519_010313, partial [Halicephalobus sp. NKZ332]
MSEGVELVDVTKENIKVVQTLVGRIFPISYAFNFFHDIVHKGKKDFNKVIRANGADVGVLLCKFLPIDDSVPDFIKFWKEEDFPNLREFVKTKEYDDIDTRTKVKVSMLSKKVKERFLEKNESENSLDSDSQKCFYMYISSLGIVVPRRSEGLGEVLMEHVFKLAY